MEDICSVFFHPFFVRARDEDGDYIDDDNGDELDEYEIDEYEGKSFEEVKELALIARGAARDDHEAAAEDANLGEDLGGSDDEGEDLEEMD